MPTPEKRTHRKHPKTTELSPLGARIDAAMRAHPEGALTKGALAARIGGSWTTTRVTDTMTSSPKGPTAASVCELAEALDVSLDWLLLGEAPTRPMRRDQVRTRPETCDDLAAEVRRQLYERLRWPVDERYDDRFHAIEREHLIVDGAAILAQCVTECEQRFRAQSDELLAEEHIARARIALSDLVTEMVDALPVGPNSAYVAKGAAHALKTDAVHYSRRDDNAAVRLSEDGVTALLPWWEWQDAPEALATLRRITARAAKVVAGVRAKTV